MKKYLADILTLTRFILSIILFILTFTSDDILAAFIVFILGELTDAFDGTCATKWPFPKDKTPKYRKYAAKYDMLADALLAAAFALFFIIRVNALAGLIIGITYSVAALIIDFIVYGKLLGHPDDFKKNSLMDKNFNLAKIIILTRRKVYITLMVATAAWTFYITPLNIVVKITTTILAAGVGIFLYFFLSQRRKNISRDAVNLEKKLSK